MMRLFLTIFIYIALVAGIFALHPSFLFRVENEELELKAPGLAQDGSQSVIAAAVFFPLLAAVVYYVVAVMHFSTERHTMN